MATQEEVTIASESLAAKWDASEDPAWQMSVTHPNLVNNIAKVKESGGKVLVPACGKSLDLLYLADQGVTTVGIDLSEKSIRLFLSENELEFNECAINDKVKLFEVASKPLKLYACDVRDFDVNFEGTFDIIWDRGFAGAFSSKVRLSLVHAMKPVFAAHVVKYFFNAFFIYNEEILKTYTGPPWHITVEDMKALFGEKAIITDLGGFDILANKELFPPSANNLAVGLQKKVNDRVDEKIFLVEFDPKSF